MKIAIGNDHVAVELKNHITKFVEAKGYTVVNFGTDSSESCDYPVYGEKVARAVASGECDLGILICGTGIGISLAANKVKGIRCAKVTTGEEAKYTRNDNDANIVAFGEKTPLEEAINIVETFINTPFSNLEKHKRRIAKITEYEENN